MGLRGPKPKLDKVTVMRAMYDTGGIYEAIAKKLGVRRETIMEIIKNDELLQEVRKEEKQRMLDIAEMKLLSSIKMGESYAITFFLKTQGRDRGYQERTEITTPKDEPIQINISVPELPDNQTMIEHNQTIALQFNIGAKDECQPASNQSFLKELPEQSDGRNEPRRRTKFQELLDNTIVDIEDVPGEEEEDSSSEEVSTKSES